MKKLLIFIICTIFMFAGCQNKSEIIDNQPDNQNTNEDNLQTEELVLSDAVQDEDTTLSNTVPDELTEPDIEPDIEAEKDVSKQANVEESEYIRLFFDDTKPVIGMYGFRGWIGNKPYYGLIDSNGKLIVPPKYYIARDSTEGYSVVRIHNDLEKGYYDMFGNKITSEYIQTFVNLQGEECFGYFSYACCFSEGIAMVQDACEKWHAINTAGEVVHSFEQSDIDFTGTFKEGMLCFTTADGKNGYIDKSFEIVIDPIFEMARNFSDGLAAVSVDGKLSYIDKTGNVVIQTSENCESQYSGNDMSAKERVIFSDGLAAISHYDEEINPEGPVNSYYIDKSGEIVIDNVYGSGFTQGLAATKDPESNKMGFIDKTGNFVIAPQYSLVFPFNDCGLAMVFGYERVSSEYREIDISTKYYCGYINTKGEIVIPLEYYSKMKYIQDPWYANGVIELYKDGYTYFFNTDGELIGKIESGF